MIRASASSRIPRFREKGDGVVIMLPEIKGHLDLESN